jgi:hypothetical protein
MPGHLLRPATRVRAPRPTSGLQPAQVKFMPPTLSTAMAPYQRTPPRRGVYPIWTYRVYYLGDLRKASGAAMRLFPLGRRG